MEEELEKYAVDRIEEGFAVLENIKTREIKLVELLLLPVVKEKDILVKIPMQKKIIMNLVTQLYLIIL